jgi:predicted transposase/invertase (TIGR01784 family)
MERTVLVVLHQLPKTKDTVWLRMLGRASFQQQAINDFVGMSAPAALTDTVTELLANYRAILEAQGRLTEEEEELIMNLSAAYQKKKQEWLEEGKEEGEREGKKEGIILGVNQVALNLLQEGFTLDLIAKATKLSIAEIERLRSSLES